MRAAIYKGPRAITIADLPEPAILEPTDAIVRVTLTRVSAGTGCRSGPRARTP